MLRMGIIGAGRIAERLITELAAVPGITAAAVYHPLPGRGKEFAASHGIPEGTDSLSGLSGLTDAVYIASPHETHFFYAREMLSMGKHVLCEKPMALRRREAEELYRLSEERGLVLLEALKTAFCPGFLSLEKRLREGAIGEIVEVEAAFTRLTPTNLRECRDAEYGGSFTELSSYVLLPLLRFLGTDYTEVRFQSLLSPNGTDRFTKAFFSYEEAETEAETEKEAKAKTEAPRYVHSRIRKCGTAKTGLSVKSEGQLLISGTRGYALLPSPWWLTRYFELRYEDTGKTERHSCEFEGAGLRYELAFFLEETAGGSPSAFRRLLAEESIRRAEILEEFLRSRSPRRASEQEKAALGIWAHRGCSFSYPENTLLAFRKAAELSGLRGVELDIQLSRDGEPMVFHDETVERTRKGKGRVGELLCGELQALPLRYASPSDRERFLREAAEYGEGGEHFWLGIPRLSELLSELRPFCLSRGLLLNIELKGGTENASGLAERAVQEVRRAGLSEHVLYSSFAPELLEALRRADPQARTAMLAMELRDCLEKGKEAGADDLHPWDGGLGEAGLLSMGDAAIRCWNSGEALYGSGGKQNGADLREAALYGVTDIFTNEPERYLYLRDVSEGGPAAGERRQEP